MIQELNAALLAKLAAGKLLRARKLRVHTTVVEADIDYATDADLLEHAVRKLGGLVRHIQAGGAATRTRFRDRGRAAGRRMKQLARTLRRRTGVAMSEVDRLTGQVAQIARQTLQEVQVLAGNARRSLTRRPGDERLGRLVGELAEMIAATQRLLAQTDQRLDGNRVIPDRPTEFGYTLLLAEDERGFVADHQVEQGNPPDAPQLVPAVGRVITVTGRPPGTVVGGRGSAPPPTPRPWQPWASSGSACSATALQARPGWRWSGPGGSGGCATGGSGSRRASATASAASGCAHAPAAAGWRPHLGRPRDLRLQPAAHDRSRRMTRTPAINLAAETDCPPPTRTFFSSK